MGAVLACVDRRRALLHLTGLHDATRPQRVHPLAECLPRLDGRHVHLRGVHAPHPVVRPRWAVDAGNRWPRIAIHLGASVVFSLLSTALEVPLLAAIGMLPLPRQSASFAASFWALLPYDLHGGIIRYWAVIGLQALFRSNQEARRREREALELKVQSSQLAEQLTAAQLSALKMQMHPHFLFNALSAIMVLVRQRKTQEAETMLSRLSDLLRHTLDDVETQEVPLWRELDFLRLYLSIEQVRFEDRLRVRIDAGPEVTDALFPHMVLQPIVENAVRHGLGQSEEPVLIHACAG
jgi:two-component system, LytTR family, sensor kinase